MANSVESTVYSSVLHNLTLSHLPTRRVVPYTVVYVTDGERVLMIDRNDKPLMSRHILGPGGRMEPGETPWSGAARELYEETGLSIPSENYDLRGVFIAEYADNGIDSGSIAPVFLLVTHDPTLSERNFRPCNEGTLGLYTVDAVLRHERSPSSQRKFFDPVLRPRDRQSFYLGVGWYQGRDMLLYQDNLSNPLDYRQKLIRRLITQGAY